MILNLKQWSLTAYHSRELLNYYQPSVSSSEYYFIPPVAMAVSMRRRFFFTHFSLDQLLLHLQHARGGRESS
jgi:hypothetical protein